MDKPGSWNLRHGLLWLLGGAALAWATFTYLGARYSIVFWAAILYGAGQLGVGLWRRARHAFLRPQEKTAAHAEADWTTLLRCMAMVASADGVADESEIEAIHQIYEQVVGEPPADGHVREVIEEVETDGDSPGDFLTRLGPQASPEMRLLIGRACWLVVNAGEGSSPPEERMFGTIVEALEIPRAAVVGEPDLSAAPRERPA